MAFLPLLFFVVISIAFFLRKPGDYRESILKAFLVTFLLIAISTELLSIFNMITSSWILISWLIINLLSIPVLIFSWIKFKSNKGIPPLENSEQQGEISKGLIILCLGIVLLISGITLFIALKSPPNNFDSMTYHMARIPHWIQNQNINYYPTAIPRQNYSMPLAEFGILHLQLLSKSDLYANLIQWLSFIIAILTTTMIARELGISRRGQWITAVLTATLPMAILQSTSTQNDLVVGVFCLSFFYFLSKAVKDLNWENAIFAAGAMGLALATKGTAYIFCAAIGGGIGGYHLLGKKWPQIKDLTLRYVLIILFALLLNSGIYLRNWRLYNNPLITSNERTMVEEISPAVLFSNLVRNGAIHLATPVQPANNFIQNTVSRMLGSQINNPAATFQGSIFKINFSINEDEAGNVLHFLLFTLSILVLPWGKKKNHGKLNPYLLVVILSLLLYSLTFKWQPWGGRLQTPIFLLGCVLTGLLIDTLFNKRFIPAALVILFLISSTPYLLLNSNRPLLPLWEDDTVFYDTEIERKIYTGIHQNLEKYPVLSQQLSSALSIFYEGRSVVLTDRRELYFLGNVEPYYSYKGTSHYIRNDSSNNIGLIMDNNQWEYPLWVYIGQHASRGPKNIYHINIDDISGTIPNNNPQPDLILVTSTQVQDLINSSDYELVSSSTSIQVFKLIE